VDGIVGGLRVRETLGCVVEMGSLEGGAVVIVRLMKTLLGGEREGGDVRGRAGHVRRDENGRKMESESWEQSHEIMSHYYLQYISRPQCHRLQRRNHPSTLNPLSN
jgi:hypothetical protein